MTTKSNLTVKCHTMRNSFAMEHSWITLDSWTVQNQGQWGTVDLARLGAWLPFMGSGLVGIPNTETKGKILTKHEYRLTVGLLSSIHWAAKSQVSLITGHTDVNCCRHKIGVAVKKYCRFWVVKKETTMNIICDYPELSNTRRRIRGIDFIGSFSYRL